MTLKYITKSIIGIIAFIPFCIVQQADAQNQAFTLDEVIKVSGIMSDGQIAGLNTTQKQTTYTYYDGLGRLIQTVGLRVTPSQKDIVQPVIYDNAGRVTTSYLPYTNGTTDGSYHTTPTTEQAAFYSNGDADKVKDDSAPYSQQIFENSPLQRLLKSGLVGTNFQPTVSGAHYKSVIYRPNASATDGNIINWGPDGNNLGSFSDNTLNVTEATDEDGAVTQSFADISGHVVLKRQKADAGALYDTYYIYNNADVLYYIVPPKAIKIMLQSGNYSLTQAGINKLVYKYMYDSMGRMVEKTIPGAAVVNIVYDPLNRPVLIQDGNLRNTNQWNYIKYDAKGRVASQGVYTDATYTTRLTMQAHVSNDLLTAYNTNWFESRSSNATNGYYTNNVFPTAGIQDLAYSYYDDYDLNQDGAADYTYATSGLSGEGTATALLRGMATIVRQRTVGQGLSNIWLMKAMFYDNRGRIIQVRSNNQLNYTAGVLTDAQTNVVDFVGKTTLSKMVKVTGSGAANTTTIQSTITYDHMYRLNAIDQQYNNSGSNIRVATYEYNELGQLVKKNLQLLNSATIPADVNLNGTNSVASGSTSAVLASHSITLSPGFTAASGSVFSAKIASNYLQAVDYRYNIRGQLTSINNSKLANDGGTTNGDSNDLFGMNLLYDQTDGNLGNSAYFNGKLSAVEWMTRDANNVQTYERSYKYNYDAANRYTGAIYAERATASTGAFSNNVGGFNESGITYDYNGNILSLQRNSSTQGTNTNVQVDNLTYNYDDTANPNQLKSVTDGSGANYTGFGFRNLTGSTSNYVYDTNSGNLTTDPYKGLSLGYNVLNRTDKITITTATNRFITYTYNAGGTLIRKQQFDNNTLQNTTDYVEGSVYINGALSYTTMPEGRLLNVSGTLKAEYVITDQQGNARVSFQDNGSGVAIVKQENSYYGFGLVMPNSLVSLPGTPNKQLYNGGSEWQNDYGNLPDYYQTYYRNYDPAIGRWISVDPMAEVTSSLTTYQYAGNDPIIFNDPLGNYKQAAQSLDEIIGQLNNYGHGGSWSSSTGIFESFHSNKDALAAGASKMDEWGAWGTYGAAVNYRAAAVRFNQYLLQHPGQGRAADIDNQQRFIQTDQWFHQDNGDAYAVNGISVTSVITDLGGAEVANQGAPGDPTYRLRHIIKDGIEQDNTPFLILFPVLKGVKTIYNLITLVKEDPEAELQSIRELKNYKYDPRLQDQTDLYHNFPQSFDKIIIDNAPWAQRVKDGANWFEYPGWVNDKPGNFQIGINDQGVIFHRNFVPLP